MSRGIFLIDFKNCIINYISFLLSGAFVTVSWVFFSIFGLDKKRYQNHSRNSAQRHSRVPDSVCVNVPSKISPKTSRFVSQETIQDSTEVISLDGVKLPEKYCKDVEVPDFFKYEVPFECEGDDLVFKALEDATQPESCDKSESDQDIFSDKIKQRVDFLVKELTDDLRAKMDRVEKLSEEMKMRMSSIGDIPTRKGNGKIYAAFEGLDDVSDSISD